MDENQTEDRKQRTEDREDESSTGNMNTDSKDANDINTDGKNADERSFPDPTYKSDNSAADGNSADSAIVDSSVDEVSEPADVKNDIDPDFENDPSKNPAFNPAFNYTPPKPPGNIPPQGMPQGYDRQMPPPGQMQGFQPQPGQYKRMPSPYDYEAFMRAKASRRFPKGAVFAGAVIIILIAVIISMLSYMANTGAKFTPSSPYDNSEQRDITLFKPSENAVNITVEQVSRPSLTDAEYINKEAGLMTTEGISNYVMPSVALISVYQGNYFSPIANGSGVIMSANGYIITNAHVVMDGSAYSVTLSDGEVYEAQLVGMSIANDVAVLKISAEGLTPATFGKTDDVRLGEEVAIVASSGATFDNFCTFGHVSNTERLLSSETSTNLKCFQTDAAVNAGTSGGPVVNMYGQCIGIVVGKYIDLASGMYENMGFVIQIDTVLETAESLIENGYVEGEVILGILYLPLDNITADAYDVPSGLLISEVIADSGAYAAGILPNDIITKINGLPVLSAESVAAALEGKRAGDTVIVEIARKKITGEVETKNLPVVLKQKIDLPGNETYTPETTVTE
jgi:serine protease Do